MQVAQYRVIIAGDTYIGSYKRCKELRAQAIRMGVGCSGIQAHV